MSTVYNNSLNLSNISPQGVNAEAALPASSATTPAQQGFLLKPFVPTPVPIALSAPLVDVGQESGNKPLQPNQLDFPQPKDAEEQMSDTSSVASDSPEHALAGENSALDPNNLSLISGTATLEPKEFKAWAVEVVRYDVLNASKHPGLNTIFKLFQIVGAIIVLIVADSVRAVGYSGKNAKNAYDSWKANRAISKLDVSKPAQTAQPAITLQPVQAPVVAQPSVQVQAPANPDKAAEEFAASFTSQSINAAMGEATKTPAPSQPTPALDKLMKTLRQGATLAHELKRKKLEEHIDLTGLSAFLKSAESPLPQPKETRTKEQDAAVMAGLKEIYQDPLAKSQLGTARTVSDFQKAFKSKQVKDQLEKEQRKLQTEYLDYLALSRRLDRNADLNNIGNISNDKKHRNAGNFVYNFNRACRDEGKKLAFFAGEKTRTVQVSGTDVTASIPSESSENILKAVSNLKQRLDHTLSYGYVDLEDNQKKANEAGFALILKEASASLTHSFLESVQREMGKEQEVQGYLVSVLRAFKKIDKAADAGILVVDSAKAKSDFLMDIDFEDSLYEVLGKEFTQAALDSSFDEAIELVRRQFERYQEIVGILDPEKLAGFGLKDFFEKLDGKIDVFGLIEADRQRYSGGYLDSVVRAEKQIEKLDELLGIDPKRNVKVYLDHIVGYKDNCLPELRKEFKADCKLGALTDVLAAIKKFDGELERSNLFVGNEIAKLMEGDITQAIGDAYLSNLANLKQNNPDMEKPEMEIEYALDYLNAIKNYHLHTDVKKILWDKISSRIKEIQAGMYDGLVKAAVLEAVKGNLGLHIAVDYAEKYIKASLLNANKRTDFITAFEASLENEVNQRQDAARAEAQLQAQKQAEVVEAELAQLTEQFLAQSQTRFNAVVKNAGKLHDAFNVFEDASEKRKLQLQNIRFLNSQRIPTKDKSTVKTFLEWHSFFNDPIEGESRLVQYKNELKLNELYQQYLVTLKGHYSSIDSLKLEEAEAAGAVKLAELQFDLALSHYLDLYEKNQIWVQETSVLTSDRDDKNDTIAELIKERKKILNEILAWEKQNAQLLVQPVPVQAAPSSSVSSSVHSGTSSASPLVLPRRPSVSSSGSGSGLNLQSQTLISSGQLLTSSGSSQVLNLVSPSQLQGIQGLALAPNATLVISGTPSNLSSGSDIAIDEEDDAMMSGEVQSEEDQMYVDPSKIFTGSTDVQDQNTVNYDVPEDPSTPTDVD